MDAMEREQWDGWWDAAGEAELRTILLTQWDPLLVGDAAQAQDEYDGYLGELGDLLREGATSAAVSDYLASCEKRMGFIPQAAELTPVAGRIAEWYASALPEITTG
jgi:hypothetical protein